MLDMYCCQYEVFEDLVAHVIFLCVLRTPSFVLNFIFKIFTTRLVIFVEAFKQLLKSQEQRKPLI